MAWYPEAIKKELPQSATAPIINPTGVVMHTAVSSGTSLFTFFNGRSAGVEAHFYIREDGTVEQYVDTAKRADCQLDGNSWVKNGTRYGFLSIESWDGGHPETTPWNGNQVTAIVKLIAWMISVHNFPAVKATGPQGTGIGFHAQFTTPASSTALTWNHSHSCPALKRIAQMPTIINTVKTFGQEIDMPLTTAEKNEIAELTARKVLTLDGVIKIASGPEAATLDNTWTLSTHVTNNRAQNSNMLEDVKALTATVTALANQVAAIAAKLDSTTTPVPVNFDLTGNLTATPKE